MVKGIWTHDNVSVLLQEADSGEFHFYFLRAAESVISQEPRLVLFTFSLVGFDMVFKWATATVS